MKRMNSHLDRLLKSAAEAPVHAVASLPFAVETRVLAAWRNGEFEPEVAAVVALLRRGLVCACGLAAVVATVCWFNLAQPAANVSPEEFALSADALNLALAR